MKPSRRWVAFLAVLASAGALQSCTTLLGTSLRDAAVDGAASFVEAATVQLLDRWIELPEEE